MQFRTCLLGAAMVAQTAFAATVIDLGGFAGGDTHASGINNHGQITGYSRVADGSEHAYIYDQGVLTDLGTGTGSQSSGAAINNSGEVAGRVLDANGNFSAAIFSGGSVIEVGAQIGSPSIANAINSSGVIAGDVLANNIWHAFTYQRGAGFTYTTYTPRADANGINDSGTVVGTGPSTFFHHAFLYSGNSSTDLGAFNGYFSEASAINNSGVVVGSSQFNSTTDYEAFIWTSTGGIIPLGTLDGIASSASAVNSAGDVVGWSGSSAFLYSGGALIDLNTLLPANSGWQLLTANGINDNGQIVGEGLLNGVSSAFLLDLNGSPAPEPAAWQLATAGLALGLCALRRRR